jgi:hypothetical protein
MRIELNLYQIHPNRKMENNITIQRRLYIIRTLIALLFVSSAILKLLPIEAFEKTIYATGYFDKCLVPYVARAIIVIELFMGVLILQKHFLKKFIITGSIVLLVVFCLHLGLQLITSGNGGNCGCMGELIPMTPVQAILKNLLSLGLLIYLYVKTPTDTHRRHRYLFLPLIAITALIFYFYPVTCCCNESSGQSSVFSKYIAPSFDAENGIKVVALFNTTCDHCMEVGKQLASYTNQPIHILFGSDSNAHGAELKAEIDNFFQETGKAWEFDTLEWAVFSNLINNYPPRVVILNDGKIVGDFEGAPFEIAKFDSTLKAQ